MNLTSQRGALTVWVARFVILLVAGVLFVVVLATIGGGMLLYRIVSPVHSGAVLDPASLMGRPNVVDFSVPGGSLDGWFFPGRTSAPTIVLCHGYQSDRGALLSLITALQEHQYNVFVFDFSGHGSRGGTSSLGYTEAEELRAALDAISQRDDVDPNRFGIWGADLGAYAALSVAARDPRVRALAIDTVYAAPLDLFDHQIARSGLGGVPLIPRFARWGFFLFNFSQRQVPALSGDLAPLAGVAKLFIIPHDNPALADVSRELFIASPDPKQQELIPRSDYARLDGPARKNYESMVVNFFLQNLSPGVPARR